jgi:hypothetical protein
MIETRPLETLMATAGAMVLGAAILLGIQTYSKMVARKAVEGEKKECNEKTT